MCVGCVCVYLFKFILQVQALNVLAYLDSWQMTLKCYTQLTDLLACFTNMFFFFYSFLEQKSFEKLDLGWSSFSPYFGIASLFVFSRLKVIYDSLASSSSINLEGTFRAELFLNA